MRERVTTVLAEVDGRQPAVFRDQEVSNAEQSIGLSMCLPGVLPDCPSRASEGPGMIC